MTTRIDKVLNFKSSDCVKNKQKYPHSELRFEFVNESIEFNDLDINLLVAGELEIITGTSSKTERNGRLEFLKRLMYLASYYEFSIIRNLYAAVLREVELGHKTWNSDFQYMENTILTRQKPKKQANASGAKNRQGSTSQDSVQVWFCTLYNRNKCSNTSPHTVTIKGKLRLVKHICATCWKTDHKELNHPECSSACPRI